MATTFPINPEDRIPSAPLPEVMAPNLQQEARATQAELSRPRASVFDTIKAGAQEWATSDIARWMTTDTYEPEKDFNLSGRLLNLNLTLSEEEQDYLLRNKAVSNAQFDDQVERLKQRRQNHRAMGDNPITGVLSSMGDPVWWGLAFGSAGVGAAARTVGAVRTVGQARAVVGGTEALGAAGIGAVQREVSPTDMAEIAVNVIASGVGGQLAFRGNRAWKDPEWPTAELKELQLNTPPVVKAEPAPQWVPKLDAEGNQVFSPSGKPVYIRQTVDEVVDISSRRTFEVKQVADEAALAAPGEPVAARRALPFKGSSGKTYDATDTTTVLARLKGSSDQMVAQLARHLEAKAGPLLQALRVFHLDQSDLLKASPDGKPRYLQGDHQVLIGTDTSDAIVLHELAHGATAAKLNYGIQNPTSAHGKLTRELEQLRRLAKEQADKMEKEGWTPSGDYHRKYLTQNVHEFVAGLYTGDTAFLRMLANLKVPAKRTNVLTE